MAHVNLRSRFFLCIAVIAVSFGLSLSRAEIQAVGGGGEFSSEKEAKRLEAEGKLTPPRTGLQCGGVITTEGEGTARFETEACSGYTVTRSECWCKRPNGDVVKSEGSSFTTYAKCDVNCRAADPKATVAETVGIGLRKPAVGTGCLRGPTCGGCWEKTVFDDAIGTWVEFCPDGRRLPYTKCFCSDTAKKETTPLDTEHAYSYEQCKEKCTAKGLTMDATQGIGKIGPPSPAGAGLKGQESGVNYLRETQNLKCFTPAECSSKEYGGSVDAFVKNTQECGEGRGFCLAQEPEITLSTPVLGTTNVKGLRNYIDLLFRFLLSIVVITTTVMFVYGGFKYILGATAGSVSSAKEIMTNALIGLVLTFGAVTLLRTLNPDTLKFDRLKVYLIKKQQLATLNLCSEYGKSGTRITFADAGTPPGSKSPNDQKAYTIEAGKTDCGKEYYPQGFGPGSTTCHGEFCPQGTSCLLCAPSGFIPGGTAQCGGKKPTERACVNVPFGGSISWTDYTEPLQIELMPVCGSVQVGKFPLDPTRVVRDSLPQKGSVSLKAGAKDIFEGKQSYILQVTEDHIKAAQSACSGQEGGLRGYVLGVVYRDFCNVKAELTKAYIQSSQGRDASYFHAATCKASANDALIVTKRDCGNTGNTYYAGYANGANKASGNLKELNLGPARYAVYCGSIARPTGGFPSSKPKRTGAFDFLGAGDPKQPYWTVEEMLKAAKGETSITCNLNLNAFNAPRNPGQHLMGGCSYSFLEFQKGEDGQDTFEQNTYYKNND